MSNIKQTPLTKDDFTNTCWENIVNSCEQKDCLSYQRAFWKKAQEVEKSENVREKTVFEILAYVTGAVIKPESTDESCLSDIFNLTNDQLDFLAEIAPEISDPELQARVADILWIKQRKYEIAKLAIPAYLESARTLENPEHWTYCFDRIARALQLALKIQSQEQVVFKYIEEVLDRYQGQDHLWLSAKLMELLQDNKHGEPAKYANLAENAANSAESISDWERARCLWAIKAKWHRMENDKRQEFNASMSVAETYVKQAESCLQETQPSYLRASRLLQNAVEAFRQIRGTKEETVDAKRRADEVHKLLLQYQEKTHDEMITISSDQINISTLVEVARNRVTGKNFREALFALVLCGTLTNVAKLRQQVQQENHLISRVVPCTMVNEMGKTVASQSKGDSILFEMYRIASFYQNLQAQAYIEPAREQINLEHGVSINDFRFIVIHSPFVPPEHEYLFAKGLYAGLTGDFYTSTHILIPQIENSVRYLMWQRGIITSGLNDSGVQNEHNLNSTLYHQEITSIFHENILFDLKCLLVEHAGSNLRNRMAHGLLRDSEFMSPLMSYIWWLTLRLVCLPILDILGTAQTDLAL